MNCRCHDAPAYWQKDGRLKAGGWWECPVKRAAFNATRTTNPKRRERLTQASRDRYDNDPIYRIEKNLRDDAKRRRATIIRNREALRGPLPQ